MSQGPRRLYRSSQDKRVYGVCGGLAQYIGVDPQLVRILTLVALFVTGGAVGIGYILARFMIPWDDEVDKSRDD